MRCPKCQSLKDHVIDSNRTEDGDSVRRRRECESCGYRFTTFERVDRAELPKLVDHKGVRIDLSECLVREVVYDACYKLAVSRIDIDMVVLSIIRLIGIDGRCEIPIDQLHRWVAEELGKVSEVARVRFEMVSKRPQNISECMEIILDYVRRITSR